MKKVKIYESDFMTSDNFDKKNKNWDKKLNELRKRGKPISLESEKKENYKRDIDMTEQELIDSGFFEAGK